MSRGHNRIVLLAALAMMTFDRTNLQAQNSTTNAALAASVSEPILTPAQQKVILTIMAAHGHDVALNSSITTTLGISKGAEVLTLRQLAATQHPSLYVHTYIPLPDSGLMLIFNDHVVASSYRLDANLKLLTAVSKKSTNAPVAIPIPDAERNVQTELAFWAGIANNP